MWRLCGRFLAEFTVLSSETTNMELTAKQHQSFYYSIKLTNNLSPGQKRQQMSLVELERRTTPCQRSYYNSQKI
ncbi:hypothetical protein RRG08_032952 [Elysia crispata]|uniref:Uncharacterized protein n=1 Tax=Elysia crispata TaxID=231223 RepID=A0AAE1D3K1_9GAST|nr:hypothetical protein RRG08_032952 [Elysia crispata]